MQINIFTFLAGKKSLARLLPVSLPFGRYRCHVPAHDGVDVHKDNKYMSSFYLLAEKDLQTNTVLCSELQNVSDMAV